MGAIEEAGAIAPIESQILSKKVTQHPLTARKTRHSPPAGRDAERALLHDDANRVDNLLNRG